MERQISLEDISGGKLYTLNDMVKADCQDYERCSTYCRGIRSSIVLDPMDIYRLSAELDQTFEEMLASGSMELDVVDGMILPNLKMSGDEERCKFLDEAGRCSIHPHRPGIYRLFPLGRVYEDGSLRYFLQIHECRKGNRTEVKIKKRLDTPSAARYERYVNDWHCHLKDLQADIRTANDDELAKATRMSILTLLYLTPYDTSGDFYSQFESRLEESRSNL